jgi:multicomponent K+:H+ antiporter subunit A
MNHATFKASLFMAAGIIDHETGTRDIRRLSGLRRFMPITATLAMVAAAAMAGVPLLNGFLSKEMFFAETIEIHDNSLVDQALPYIVTAASMFTVTYSLRFIRDVFFGPPPKGLPRVPQEPPFLMRFPAELLVLACLLVGMIPALTIGPLLKTALHAVLGAQIPPYSLRLWHGFTPELLMSLVAICGGVVLYFMLHSYLLTSEGPPFLRRIDGHRMFDRFLVAVSWRLARWLETVLGTRRLQPQLLLLICAALFAGAAPFYARGAASVGSAWTPFDVAFGLVWAVGIVCALAVAYQAKFHRLAAIILLGGAGLVTCITFVWLSAPDLALTQLVVETVTTVLLLLGLRWLPKRVSDFVPWSASTFRWYRVRDFSLAVASGCGLAALSYVVMTRPPLDSIGGFFVENAYTRGGGTNVVNVILVDFRAFDTFGEISVLGIVAITVYALLRRFRPAADSIPVPEQQRAQASYDQAHPDRLEGDTIKNVMAVPALMMGMLFPVICAAAVFLFLRGHDLPGGGFVAGVTMGVAFILQYMARGTVWVEARLRVLPMRWMGVGLLLAVVTGAGAWLFGKPFLTSAFSYVAVPLIGAVPLATASLFDLGVFSLVVGATVLMLIAIAHQSVRSHRTPAGRHVPLPSREAEVT